MCGWVNQAPENHCPKLKTLGVSKEKEHFYSEPLFFFWFCGCLKGNSLSCIVSRLLKESLETLPNSYPGFLKKKI